MSKPSQAQIDANRANAKHSHGPNSDRGKKRSSQNALRHGLTGRIVVLPTEDMEAYLAFAKELVDSLNPETPMERQFAQTVADTQWRLNRARTFEDGMIALGNFDFNTGSAQVDSALSAAKVFQEHSKDFVNLSLYEQRLSRAQREAFKQLQDLQAKRKTDTEMRLPAALPEPEPKTQAATAATEMVRPAPCLQPYPLDTEEDTRTPGQQIGFVNSATDYDPGAFDPIYFKNAIPVETLPGIPEERKAA